MAPTTTEARLKKLSKLFSGWVYSLNFSGITGSKPVDLDEVKKMIKRIKNHTDLPICSGFGIKSPEDAKKIANAGCDGIIVGSSIVDFITKNLDDTKLPENIGKNIENFVKQLR